MLDVSVRGLSFRYSKSAFQLRDLSLVFPASKHTAIIGPAGCGSTTLLKIIAGELSPSAGEVVIGTRDVTSVPRSRRPLLFVTSEIDVPGRWSVQHALVNAVRSRSLDRVDRQHELSLAASKWEVEELLDRRVDTLSASESVRLHGARIELVKPAILVADRLFASIAAPALRGAADQFYRTLRVMGTTVISAPSDYVELGFTDDVVVLDGGTVIQRGNAAAVFTAPHNAAAAAATADVNVIPITIRGREIESSVGAWEIDDPPFQGSGVALARPEAFQLAAAGEESHFIFGIEEASFEEGHWIAQGLVTGGGVLRVALPRSARIQKGRILPLRYDPAEFTLIQQTDTPVATRVPAGGVPSLRDSR